jgi:hypothetical protein
VADEADERDSARVTLVSKWAIQEKKEAYRALRGQQASLDEVLHRVAEVEAHQQVGGVMV